MHFLNIKKINPWHHNKIKEFWQALWNFMTSKTGAFIIGVSAIAIGYYQFYVSRPIMKYAVETTPFISSLDDNDFKVSVHGNDYKDLYISRVYLINKGQQALAGSDVSKIGHDPIRIVIPDEAKMAHYAIDHQLTSQATSADLLKDDKDLIIKFDFINPDNQISTAILHESSAPKFYITGSALNVNSIEREWSDKEIKFWGLWGLGILYLILVLAYLYNHWYHLKKRKFKF